MSNNKLTVFKSLHFRVPYYVKIVTGISSDFGPSSTIPVRHSLTLEAVMWPPFWKSPFPTQPLANPVLSISLHSELSFAGASLHFLPFFSGKPHISIPLLCRIHCVPSSTSKPADHSHLSSLSNKTTSRHQISPFFRGKIWTPVMVLKILS